MDKPRIDPQRWMPPKAPPLEGRWAPRDSLAGAQRWETGGRVGPEDPVVAPDGRVFAGTDDGSVLAFGPDGTGPTVVCRMEHRRPHGMEWHPDGWLAVCDSRAGALLRVDPDTGATEVLVERVDDLHLQYVNNATVTADGSTIYFTESARVGNVDHPEADAYAHSSSGRVFRHDVATGETEVVWSGLKYANGVTLLPDESSLLVAETTGYAIRELRLTGDRAGQRRVFAYNLPALPDNLSTGPSGTIWVACPVPRNAILDALLPRPPVLRRIVWALPDVVRPKVPRVAMALGFDVGGRLTHHLRDPKGRATHYVTGVREHDGWLYLGSLHDTAIARVPLEP